MELIKGGKQGTGLKRHYENIFLDESEEFKLGTIIGVARERLRNALDEVDLNARKIHPVGIAAPHSAREKLQRLADHFDVDLTILEDDTPSTGSKVVKFVFKAKESPISVVK
jgi:hypothetical protein